MGYKGHGDTASQGVQQVLHGSGFVSSPPIAGGSSALIGKAGECRVLFSALKKLETVVLLLPPEIHLLVIWKPLGKLGVALDGFDCLAEGFEMYAVKLRVCGCL